jgi:ADP-heptose:LPS heptosyltransferase
LIITVDTMTAHLAGALGIPVWILLPARADWRWMLNRPDSPWYPTATLFRQKKEGDWKGVITQVVESLCAFP